MVLDMEIGARLKEAREAKNLTLDELQQMTKIQKRYLQAIEQSNFDVMPGRFYVRAFIKEYATAVGLEPEILMEEHEAELPKATDDSSIQYTRVKRSKKDSATPAKSPAIFSFLPSVAVVLLIVGAIFLVWNFYQKSVDDAPQNVQEQENGEEEILIESDDVDSEDEGETGQDTQNNPDEENTDSPADPTETEKPEEEPKSPKLKVVKKETNGNEPVTTYELVNPSEKVNVELKTESESWLEVSNGKGKEFFKNMFRAEQSPLKYDMTGEDRIYIRVGSAPNLDITVNGVPLTYEVDPNEYVLQKIWINIADKTE
jgi:cytoskeletal protein RodZ